MYFAILPVVLLSTAPADMCTRMRSLNILEYPGGACVVEQLTQEARRIACNEVGADHPGLHERMSCVQVMHL
jgi:hypothetical protein